MARKTLSPEAAKIVEPILTIGMPLLFILIGIAMLFAPAVKSSSCTYEVTGTVIENRAVHTAAGGHRRITYEPVFSFTYNGQEYTIPEGHGTAPAEYEVGQKVQMWINPDDPHDFYVKNSSSDNLMGILFTVLGIITLVLFRIGGRSFKNDRKAEEINETTEETGDK